MSDLKNTFEAKAAMEQYVANGEWKCEKSPSGAHVWIYEDDGAFCEHCLVRKEPPPEESRQCPECGEEKPGEAFPRMARGNRGKMCTACRNLRISQGQQKRIDARRKNQATPIVLHEQATGEKQIDVPVTDEKQPEPDAQPPVPSYAEIADKLRRCKGLIRIIHALAKKLEGEPARIAILTVLDTLMGKDV